MTDLPDWVWQLLVNLDYYEDTHPLLYRMTDPDAYERTACAQGAGLLNCVPSEIWDVARLLRDKGAVTIQGERP